MTQGDPPVRQLDFQELAELRRQTEVISRALQEQLQTHLETLRPIISPERVLGKHVGAKVDPAGADRVLAQLQQSYRPFTARPFDLPSELDPHWLTLVGTRVTLYPWEYPYEIKTERETKTISMSSPVRWVMSYTSAYSLTQIRQAMTGGGERRPEHVRQFVVNALVTQAVIAHTPGLADLLTDLRYQLRTDHIPDLPRLPLTTITSGVPSFRPADDLIQAATGFSGIPAFVEVVDLDAISRIQDPLKARIAGLLG